MGELKVDDWKWNVWEMDLKTGKRKRWLGSISNPKDGFAWLKSMGKDAKKFRINNVPPETSTMQNPPREVYATSAVELHEGDALPERKIAGKYDDFTPRAKRKAVSVPKSEGGRGTAVVRRPAAPKPKDTKEMKKIKADAQVILDRHKADEAAEMGSSDGE